MNDHDTRRTTEHAAEFVAASRRWIGSYANRATLRELAHTQLTDARWVVSGDGKQVELAYEDYRPVVARRPKGDPDWEATAEYIAAFDPARAIALLDELEHLLTIVGDWSVDPEDCGACLAMGSDPCPYHRGTLDGAVEAGSLVKRFVDNGFEVPLPPKDELPVPARRTVPIKFHCTACKVDALAAHVAGDCCPYCGLVYEWLPKVDEDLIVSVPSGGGA